MIRRYNVFGAPRVAHKIMKEVKIGDFLIIYLLRPTNGIVAIYRIVSEPYEENSDIRGRDRYPLRINLEIYQDIEKLFLKPLPLSSVYGGNSRGNITVEPFFKNIWLTKIGANQYESLLRSLGQLS